MVYLLIDFRHVAYKARTLPPLSAPVKYNDTVHVVDTTVASFAVKDVWRKSERGKHNVGVFLEGGQPGVKSFRYEYFANLAQQGIMLTEGYKSNRKGESNSFFEATQTAENLLASGGVTMYRAARLEADDLIGAIVDKIKNVLNDTTTPIYILTNDNDMLPFVDDQVSVYVRSKRTFAHPGCPEYSGYYQVTPDSWYEYLLGTSEYKKFHIPYNSMLLYKLIRGDDSDNYKGAVAGFGPVKYSQMMYRMENDGVPFADIFRYGNDFETEIQPVLMDYFSEEEVHVMSLLYRGIDMIKSHNGIDLLRDKLTKPKQISIGELQPACDVFSISLPK